MSKITYDLDFMEAKTNEMLCSVFKYSTGTLTTRVLLAKFCDVIRVEDLKWFDANIKRDGPAYISAEISVFDTKAKRIAVEGDRMNKVERDRTATRQQERSYPTAMVLLCVTASILNPLLAPAVLYYIFKAQKGWSKSKYTRAYRYVNKAAVLAIVGIAITGTALVTGVLVQGIFKGENKNMAKVTKNNTIIKEVYTSKVCLNNTADEIQPKKTISYPSTVSEHIQTASIQVASSKDIGKRYINDSHVLVIDRRTNTKKIFEIPRSFQNDLGR